MESTEARREPARGKFLFLVEVILAVVCGAIGLIRLWRDGTPTAESVLMMLALPAAAAILAGALGRLAVEGSESGPHWSAALTLPLMHVAALFALAKLVEAKYTGIEAPDQIHPALVWTDPWLLAFSGGAQVFAIGAFVAILQARARRYT